MNVLSALRAFWAVALSLGLHVILAYYVFLWAPHEEIREIVLQNKSIKGILLNASDLGGGVKKRPNALPAPEPVPPPPPPVLPPEPQVEVDEQKKTKDLAAVDTRISEAALEAKKQKEAALKAAQKAAKAEAAREKALRNAEDLARDQQDAEQKPVPKLNNFEGDPNKVPGSVGTPIALPEPDDGPALQKKFASYADSRLLPHINRNWVFSNVAIVKKFPQLYARVHIKVNRLGEILLLSLDKPSGIRAYDESCLLAIKRSAPLPVPPDDIAEYLSTKGIYLGFPGKLLLENMGEDL